LKKRLLILSAGTGASNNLIRSLKSGKKQLRIVGCHYDRFVLKKSLADRNYLIPDSSESEFLETLRRLIEIERIDLVIPGCDSDALQLATFKDCLSCRVFLPNRRVIELCQDKYRLTRVLQRYGLPVARTYRIDSIEKIDQLFRRFMPCSRLWCRIRRGSGSLGSIPVANADQVRAWVKYWDEMRGVPVRDFMISEYLPGRDFCVESLWREGTLILTKMAERLIYVDNGSPSGVSSVPALAKTVLEPHIVEICANAVRSIESKASGVFFIDIKENEKGQPCITEVNAGRFPMMTEIHDLTGKYNMAVMYVELALGAPVTICNASDY
jgi:carbamoyl-phosphate synthase large subunit